MKGLSEIDGEIVRWSNEWDALSNEYKLICEEAQQKRDVYDLAKAKAMLSAPEHYKVDEKKAHVVEVCHKQAVEAHVAEATREWYRERLKALAGLLTAAQSRSRREVEELKMLNVKP